MLKNLLAHPLTLGLEIDDPRTTALRRQIMREKEFLRQLYVEWYDKLRSEIPGGGGRCLEIGSGGGFFKEQYSDLITSEVFAAPGIDLVVDARRLPFAAGTLRSILMVDVLHHIPDVELFFAEVTRCLHPGGVLAMLEPWVSPWSRFVWQNLHHEPFEPEAEAWHLPKAGPLSGANSALPWIVFQRDKKIFEQQYPFLRIEAISIDYPFSYFASGGVSLRSLLPGCVYPLFRKIERSLAGLNGIIGCFAFITLRKSTVNFAAEMVAGNVPGYEQHVDAP